MNGYNNRNSDQGMNPWAAGLIGAFATALAAAALILSKKENRDKLDAKLKKINDDLNKKAEEAKNQAASQVRDAASQAKNAAENVEKKAGEYATSDSKSKAKPGTKNAPPDQQNNGA